MSVVVPTFNNASTLEETLDSILRQSFRDFELILSDHSSTDDTWQIIQGYRNLPQVFVRRTPPGGGAAANWNLATDAAGGRYVKLVCADDLLHSDALAKQVSEFEAHGTDVVMVASQRKLISRSGKTLVHRFGLGGMTGLVPGPVAIRRSVRAGSNLFGEPCCVMLRRSSLQSVGGWQGSFGYAIDQASYFKVLQTGNMIAIPEPLASFRITPTQWSHQVRHDQATDVLRLHDETLASASPGLSAGDVRRGNGAARLRALQRRLVYIWQFRGGRS